MFSSSAAAACVRRRFAISPAIGAELNGHNLVLRVNPYIARALRDEERAVFKELKQSLGREVALRADVQLHHEQFDLMAIG